MARHTQLSRDARPLLRIVGNKRHAGDQDHEPSPAGTTANRRTNPAKAIPPPSKLHETEADVLAEPKSSSDEEDGDSLFGASNSPPVAKHVSPQKLHDGRLRLTRGAYINGEREKVSSGRRDGENVPGSKAAVNTQSQPSNTSTSDDDVLFGEAMGSQSRKRKRANNLTVYRSTTNIHTKPPLQKSAPPSKRDVIERGPTTKDTKVFKQPRSVKIDAASAVGTKAPTFMTPSTAFSIKANSSSQDEPPSFRTPQTLDELDLSSETSDHRTTASRSLFKHPPVGGVATLDNSTNIAQFQTRNPRSISTTSSSPLSSPPDSPVHSSQTFPEDLNPIPKATCPICHKSVDPELLLSFANGKSRMHVRKQAQFCRAHKQQDAREEWRRRRYPQIAWDKLGKRLAKHRGYLNDILDQRVPSHYRDQLDQKVRSGRERTLAQSLHLKGLEGLTPGYYGTRGAKVMMEDITAHFATKMRRLAGSDKLIASGGVSGYIQAVLVPELATLLVMEDMCVGKDRAREILAESIEIGDLVNEEEEDRGSRMGSQKEPISLIDANGDRSGEAIDV